MDSLLTWCLRVRHRMGLIQHRACPPLTQTWRSASNKPSRTCSTRCIRMQTSQTSCTADQLKNRLIPESLVLPLRITSRYNRLSSWCSGRQSSAQDRRAENLVFLLQLRDALQPMLSRITPQASVEKVKARIVWYSRFSLWVSEATPLPPSAMSRVCWRKAWWVRISRCIGERLVMSLLTSIKASSKDRRIPRLNTITIKWI